MSSQGSICLEPVGFVKTEVVGKVVRDKNVISQIVFHEKLTEALEGVEEFSHLFVLFWLHGISDKGKQKMKVRPRGRSDMPLLGIFATRTPHRPNPIGLTRVKILKVDQQENRLSLTVVSEEQGNDESDDYRKHLSKGDKSTGSFGTLGDILRDKMGKK